MDRSSSFLRKSLYLWNQESPDSENPCSALSCVKIKSSLRLNYLVGLTYTCRWRSCPCMYAWVTSWSHISSEGKIAASKDINLMSLRRTVLALWIMRYFYFSLCRCSINLALYRSLSVPVSFISRMNLPKRTIALGKIFFLLTKKSLGWVNPLISWSVAFLLSLDVYMVYAFSSIL